MHYLHHYFIGCVKTIARFQSVDIDTIPPHNCICFRKIFHDEYAKASYSTLILFFWFFRFYHASTWTTYGRIIKRIYEHIIYEVTITQYQHKWMQELDVYDRVPLIFDSISYFYAKYLILITLQRVIGCALYMRVRFAIDFLVSYLSTW